MYFILFMYENFIIKKISFLQKRLNQIDDQSPF